MDKLKQTVIKAFGKNFVQCDTFPDAGVVQIVLKFNPRKKLFNGKFLDQYTREDAIKVVHKVLKVCKEIGIEYDLRIALKLQHNTTVTDMVFPKAAVADYHHKQDLEAIAETFHITSGLK